MRFLGLLVVPTLLMISGCSSIPAEKLVPEKIAVKQVDGVATVRVSGAREQIAKNQDIKAAVEIAILESGLGLNPSADGQLIRVPIPALTEERRVDLSKVAGKYAEDARVAVRNIRRHAMDNLKVWERKNELSQDESREYAQLVQDLTNEFVKNIDDSLKHKEQEIMQV